MEPTKSFLHFLSSSSISIFSEDFGRQSVAKFDDQILASIQHDNKIYVFRQEAILKRPIACRLKTLESMTVSPHNLQATKDKSLPNSSGIKYEAHSAVISIIKSSIYLTFLSPKGLQTAIYDLVKFTWTHTKPLATQKSTVGNI